MAMFHDVSNILAKSQLIIAKQPPSFSKSPVKIFRPKTARILDLGCGNARLAEVPTAPGSCVYITYVCLPCLR